MYNLFDTSVLTIYQGNSLELDIYLTETDTGEPVPIEDDAYVLFTVENKNHDVVIQKKLTSSDYDTELDPPAIVCQINMDDTIDLPTGEYMYDCLYVNGDTAVTFVSSSVVISRAIGKYTDSNSTGGAVDG